MGIEPTYIRFAVALKEYVEKMDWSKFKAWLDDKLENHYAHNVYLYSSKYSHLAFTQEFADMPHNRKKLEIMRSVTNLCKYLDRTYDTSFHEQLTLWFKKKEIKWSLKTKESTFFHAQKVKPETIITSLAGMQNEECKLFAVYTLVTGLRTGESIQSIAHHEKLCNDNVIELFWDRGTKKANAVFCHPLLHNKIINMKMPDKTKIYQDINKKKLGFEIRMLRRMNFTINASKVDPLLSEFMQGRQGNISMQHYYLPYMKENYKKWNKIWTPIVKNILS